MIAVDTNILVYAHREDSPWHEQAYSAVRQLAEGRGAWALPWPCLHEFLAIVTHPRIYDPPTPLEIALEQAAAWLEAPNLVVLSERDGYWDELREIAVRARLSGAMIHEARVAALCLFHGVETLWSADRDFSRFPGLKVVNPLIAGGR